MVGWAWVVEEVNWWLLLESSPAWIGPSSEGLAQVVASAETVVGGSSCLAKAIRSRTEWVKTRCMNSATLENAQFCISCQQLNAGSNSASPRHWQVCRARPRRRVPDSRSHSLFGALLGSPDSKYSSPSVYSLPAPHFTVVGHLITKSPHHPRGEHAQYQLCSNVFASSIRPSQWPDYPAHINFHPGTSCS